MVPKSDQGSHEEPGLWQHVQRGLRGRCPQCGQGKLYAGYLKIADQCATCHHVLSGHDVGDGPVVPVMLLIGGVVVGMALWLELSFEPPLWVHGVILAPSTIGLALAVMPLVKGVNVALQHRYRSTDDTSK